MEGHGIIQNIENIVDREAFMDQDDARTVDKIVKYHRKWGKLLFAVMWKNFIAFDNCGVSCTACHMDPRYSTCSYCDNCISRPWCQM